MLLSIPDLIKQARHEGSQPRVHGNGFIQLDLSPTKRLHFWGHRRIPRQQIRTPIHDHVFDFASHILKGRLFNIRYKLHPHPEGGFVVYAADARQGSDTVLAPHDGQFAKVDGLASLASTNGRVNVSVEKCQVLSAAHGVRCYQFERQRFHESFADEPTVTLLEKVGLPPGGKDWAPGRSAGGYGDIVPRVLVPFGTDPDNAFDRHAFQPDFLWNLVREIAA